MPSLPELSTRRPFADEPWTCAATEVCPWAPEYVAGQEIEMRQGIPTTDQRQGRTLHPVGPARLGVRLDLPKLKPPDCCIGFQAAQLQLAPPAQWHRRGSANVQTQEFREHRLDGSHLVHSPRDVRRVSQESAVYSGRPCKDPLLPPCSGCR